MPTPRPLHLRDAVVWTGPTTKPARSVTIIDGRVAAIDEPAPSGARIIEGDGRAVVPGFIDAHVHLLLGGRALSALDLSGVDSRTAFEAAIARRHAELPEDEWLLANRWSEANWPDGRTPDKSWLAAAGTRPVVCHRVDLHAALVNDVVLAQCDLESTGIGDRGRIARDPVTGDPTGLMVEAAAWQLVNPLLPEPDLATQREMLLAAQAHAHRNGLTAVGSMEYQSSIESVFVPTRDELTLRCRFTVLDRAWPMTFDFGRAFTGDDVLAVIGYKSFADGTLGSRSARMLADYADDPGNRGLLLELAAEGTLAAWAQGVAAAGLSPSVHAIGDEAARIVLDAVEAVDPERRPRIEHAQHLDLVDVPRFAGVIASMQPLHKADDGRYAARRLGPHRLPGTFAFRRLRDAGAILAFGSDWPVVSCNPLEGIRAAVTGRTMDGEIFLEDQCLTVAESLEAYTAGAAYALGMDDAGHVRVGALGDLTILDRDPLTADWDGSPPVVSATVVGGEVVYDGERDGRN